MKKLKLFISMLVILTLTTGIVLAADKVANGDKILFFRDITIDEEIRFNGDIIAIFSDVKIDGIMDGDIISIFGKTEINKTLDGTIISLLGDIDMVENVIITGDKVQITVGDEDIPSTVVIGGEEITMKLFTNEMSGITALIIFLLIFFGIKNIIGFILSAILTAIVPERIDKITEETTVRIGRRMGLGIIAILIFYSATTILGVMVIGVPLIPILFIFKWLLGLGGNTALKLAIGRKISKESNWSKMTELIVGSLIYLLLDITIILKPLLYLGKLTGMGAVIDTRIGVVDKWDSYSKKGYKDKPAYKVVNKEEDIKEDTKMLEDNSKEKNNENDKK